MFLRVKPTPEMLLVGFEINYWAFIFFIAIGCVLIFLGICFMLHNKLIKGVSVFA